MKHSFDVLSGALCAFLLLSLGAAGVVDSNGSVPFLGNWTVASKAVDLASGPVSVQLGGAATQSWIQSNLGSNIWGTRMTYVFEADGTYRAAYRGRAVFGVFVSETEVEEVGRFTSEGTSLTLHPERYDGWIYVGHQSNRQTVAVTEVPPRHYEVGLVETARGEPYLFLYGTCADFQVEPWCEADDVLLDVGILYERAP